jgi:hypothetical protein
MFPPGFFQRDYFETHYFWPDWAVYITVRVGWYPTDPYAVIEVERKIQTALRLDRPIVGADLLSPYSEFVPVEHIIVIEGNETAHVQYDANAPVKFTRVNPYTDTFVDDPLVSIED